MRCQATSATSTVLISASNWRASLMSPSNWCSWTWNQWICNRALPTSCGLSTVLVHSNPSTSPIMKFQSATWEPYCLCLAFMTQMRAIYLIILIRAKSKSFHRSLARTHSLLMMTQRPRQANACTFHLMMESLHHKTRRLLRLRIVKLSRGIEDSAPTCKLHKKWALAMAN